MLYEGMTRLEAAREWVNSFNAVSTQMIAKLMKAEPDDWSEVTCPAAGDSVYVFDESIAGKVIKVYCMAHCKVELDDGRIWRGDVREIEIEHDDGLPMWGTMWSFDDSCDEYWLDSRDGIMLMSE